MKRLIWIGSSRENLKQFLVKRRLREAQALYQDLRGE